MHKVLSRQDFDKVVSYIPLPPFYDGDYLYQIYCYANEGIEELSKNTIIPSVNTIDDLEIIYYSLGEFVYSLAMKSPEENEQFKNNEDVKVQMASVVADKYLSLSMFNHVERKIANRFIPTISSLNIYINFMLNILNGYQKNDPASTLITDLLLKSLSISRCILELLIKGYETEAFSSWRTLHECECTLLLLEKYGNPLIECYLKHMRFGIAFKNGMVDKQEQDKIFYSMKDEMKEFNLKSKDIKKYIEYGWLYSIPEFKSDEKYKLNFRDGMQAFIGLSGYAKRYEISSEIIHSTPILIYSNKEYFYFLTLLSLYESFFRLEKVFVSLFSKRVSQDQYQKYLAMREVYYAQLVTIHQRETFNFKNWQKRQKVKQ